jgi:hypothetical protein
VIKLNKTPFASKLEYSRSSLLDCWKGSYANGQVALLLRDTTTGEPVAKATVAVEFPPRHDVVLKTWSENAGIVETLLAAGIIQGNCLGYHECGHAQAEVWKLAGEEVK